MKVYAVVGGWDHDGEDFDSLRLFDCLSTANAYLVYLEEQGDYDYSKIDTRKVNMESAFCATQQPAQDPTNPPVDAL
jgi:hypothetical protein